MLPIGGIAAGVGALAGAFGGGSRSLTNRDIDEAYRRGHRDFQFNPNANDPALRLQQMRASNLHRQNYGRGLNENYRAGLGGSSIALNNLQNLDTDYARQLETIGDQNLENQRNEQLGLFRDDQNYARQLQLARLNSLSGARSTTAQNLSGAVGALGGIAGEAFAGHEGGGLNNTGSRRLRYYDENQPWLGSYYE